MLFLRQRKSVTNSYPPLKKEETRSKFLPHHYAIYQKCYYDLRETRPYGIFDTLPKGMKISCTVDN